MIITITPKLREDGTIMAWHVHSNHEWCCTLPDIEEAMTRAKTIESRTKERLLKEFS